MQKLAKPLKNVSFGGPNRCLLVHWDDAESPVPLEVPMGYDEWESMRRMVGPAREAAVIGAVMRHEALRHHVVDVPEPKPEHATEHATEKPTKK